MKVSKSDVVKKFQDILNGSSTRETVDRWAYSVIKSSEMDDLIFDPPEDKEWIWKNVMYFYGIDLMEAPNEYLHTDSDIKLKFDKSLELYRH